MKKMGITILLVFVVFTVLNFVVHGVLLQPLYQQTPQLLRAEQDAQGHMLFMLLGFLIFSAAFVWKQGGDRRRMVFPAAKGGRYR